MFGNYFKHVLVLTLLAGLTYSLPQVKDAMAGAFTIGYSDASAYTAAVGDLQKSVAEQISVRSIVAKVAYDSKRQETAINISAKVQITAKTSDIKVADDSFSFTLRNRTLSLDGRYTRSSSAVSNLTKGPDGYYTIKAGTTALFSVTASANPASMVAGQYYATLVVVSTYDSKLTVPSNQSNNFVVVGEASPFITLVGQGLYGSKDTIILNAVRLGKNPTITFKPAYDICEVGQVCPPSAPKTFSLRGSHNSKQIKFNLNGKDLKPAQYQVYVTNNELGELAGKSNTVWIQVLDQSKILTAKVIAGKLALAYDAQNQEASLSALFEATIKAGETDLTLDSGSFYVSVNSNANYTGMGTQVTLKTVNGQNVPLPYILKAKKEAKFVISASVNPKIMSAGSYSMSVGAVYPLSSDGTQKVYIQVNQNETNSVVIVGETSPYITSVSPNPVKVGEKFSINGVRLNDAGFGVVYIDGAVTTALVDGSKDGSVLFFVMPSLTDGFHMLQVKTANGASNMMWFESIGGPVVPPTCPPGYICTDPFSITTKSPNGGEKFTLGNPIPVVWTSNYDSSTVKVHLYSATLGDVYVSGPLTSTGKGAGENEYIIPSNAADVIGQYKVNVCDDNQSPIGLPGKSLCDLSDNYFLISSASSTNCYTFITNLQVGSSGPDVTALQNILVAKGFLTLTPGSQVSGYFGEETKVALMAYQTSVGLPATGFAGPLTRAALNANCGGPVVTPPPPACPIGYICTEGVSTDPQVTSCPAGYICTVVPTRLPPEIIPATRSTTTKTITR